MTVLQKLWLDNHKKTSKTVLSGRFRVTSFCSWVFICGNINKVSPDFKCGGSESTYSLLYPLYFSTFDKWNMFTVLLIFFRWKVKTLLEMLKCVLCRKPPQIIGSNTLNLSGLYLNFHLLPRAREKTKQKHTIALGVTHASAHWGKLGQRLEQMFSGCYLNGDQLTELRGLVPSV